MKNLREILQGQRVPTFNIRGKIIFIRTTTEQLLEEAKLREKPVVAPEREAFDADCWLRD